MKTYTKTHTSRKAAEAHLAKIKARGGVGVMKVEKRSYKIDYYFLPKLVKTRSKDTGKSLTITKKYLKGFRGKASIKYDVLDPDGRSIRRPGMPLFESKKARDEYFEEWKNQFHRQGYWSPTKGSIIVNKLKRNCKFVELK